MKVFVRLAGGLGNQLFQIAAAFNYVDGDTNKIIIFDDHLVNYYTKRHSQIDLLFPNVFVFQSPSRFLKFFAKWRISFLLNLPFLFINEKNFYNPKIGNKFLFDGYFQNHVFLDNHINRFRDLFCRMNMEVVKKVSLFIKEHDLNSFCAVHIRRGDYLDAKYQKIYPILDDQYYTMALSKMNLVNVLVFSDSKFDESFLSNYNVMFVRDNSLTDFEEFVLLSTIPNIIIANSTFSFWAAVLNASASKRVIAPKLWTFIEKDNIKWTKNLSYFNFELV